MQCKSWLSLLIFLLVARALPASGSDAPFVKRQAQAVLLQQTAEGGRYGGVRWGFSDSDLEKPIFKETFIRPSKVREVHYWSQEFYPEVLAAHGFLVFIMEDLDGVVAEDGTRDVGRVVTVEAHYREGQDYSPIKGLFKTSIPLLAEGSAMGIRTRFFYKLGTIFPAITHPSNSHAPVALDPPSKFWA